MSVTRTNRDALSSSPYVSLQNLSLSVNDLLACCGFLCGDGCDGGYPISAWRYFVHHGVVTEEVLLYWLLPSINLSFYFSVQVV